MKKKVLEKALVKLGVGEITVFGDLTYPIIFDDVPWWKALIGVIPGGGLIYLFDEEDEENGDEDKGRLTTDGGRDRNSTVGNNDIGIDEGVYNDIGRNTSQGRLNSLSNKIPESKNILIILLALAGAVGGFLGGGLIGAAGLGAGTLLLGFAVRKLGIKSLLIGIIPIGLILVLVAFTGVGAGYTGLLNDMLGSSATGFTSSFGGLGESFSYQVSKVSSFVSCLGDAGCIRELQLNRTRRPGSQDVGETYELRVQDLSVYGSGNGVDVAYQRRDSDIPISFLLKNTRHGLKGINAKGVEYRAKVRDERIVGGTDLCKTDWIDLQKYGGDSPDNVDEDTLLPGEAVEPLSYSQGKENTINLEQCGLLQPSAGTNVDFVVQVKYNYSSKSTLQVDAMSREHRRSEDIPIDFKNSETADTPVETYIEVRSPIMFQELNGDRTPIPFRARIGVQTDERNIDYNVNPEAFELKDSGQTTDKGQCEGLEHEEGNSYKLSERSQNRIEARQKEDWFTHRNSPKPVSCQFQLDDEKVDSISATGETLTMSADVNYTVRQEKMRESFKVSNSLCTEFNCPLLVPLEADDLSENIVNGRLDKELRPGDDGYWKKYYAYCSRPQDSQPGCGVIRGFGLEERTDPVDTKPIKSRQLALNMTEEMFDTGENFVTEKVENNEDIKDQLPTVLTISEDKLRRAWSRQEAITYNKGDWQITEYVSSTESTTDSQTTDENQKAEDNDKEYGEGGVNLNEGYQ